MRLWLTTFVAFLVLVSTTPSFGDDNTELQQLEKQVAALTASLNAMNAELRELRAEFDQLKNQLAPQDGKDQQGKTQSVAPLGTIWEGKFGPTGKEQGGKMEVISRTNTHAKLQISIETGAVWTFSCRVRGDDLIIEATERQQASNGVNQLAAVGGIKGSGRVRGDHLNFKYDWRRMDANSGRVVQTHHVFDGNTK